ncbi:MAG: fructose-bisphosphate aldolase [Planctomycetota bacterium]|nr:MAG: fructose-bisphosphate aldolase [Planctomycetota bacterium]
MDVLRFFRKAKFSTGELTRVRRILRPNGTTMLLPYDQFVEHDCRHLDGKSDSGNPYYICELAKEAGFNGVVFHYGLSARYWPSTEGEVPLIVKINGKTSIPPDDEALSVHTSWVEDAVRLGAAGVGYTMYYGSPAQDRDLPQLAAVRRECERFGMPLIIWAYPRGSAINAKGGRDSSYALESAARLATEMGATIIKSNLPADKPELADNPKVPEYYRKVEKEILAISDPLERKYVRAKRVVEAAQGIPVLFSGGSEKSDEEVLANAKAAVRAGCFGFIIGRNMWKRKLEDAKRIAAIIEQALDSE